MTTIERVARNEATEQDVAKLAASATAEHEIKYNHFMQEKFGLQNMHNRFPLGSSFDLGSPYMAPIVAAMQEAVNMVSIDLLDELDKSNVEGAVVEFGVAQGGWLKPMLDHMDKTGKRRSVVGFDSFEGLSEPNKEFDYSFWYKGQIAVPMEAAAAFLSASERPHLRLVKGWVNDTLKQEVATSIKKVAFAKIDVDLYEPSVDCLEYLRDKLADGAILFFDDWCYDVDIGESKAFADWCETVPQYRFEFIGHINWRAFMRVHHVNTDRRASVPATSELVSAIINKIKPSVSQETMTEVQGLLGDLVQEAGRHNADIDRKEMEKQFFSQAAEIERLKKANAERGQ